MAQARRPGEPQAGWPGRYSARIGSAAARGRWQRAGLARLRRAALALAAAGVAVSCGGSFSVHETPLLERQRQELLGRTSAVSAQVVRVSGDAVELAIRRRWTCAYDVRRERLWETRVTTEPNAGGIALGIGLTGVGIVGIGATFASERCDSFCGLAKLVLLGASAAMSAIGGVILAESTWRQHTQSTWRVDGLAPVERRAVGCGDEVAAGAAASVRWSAANVYRGTVGQDGRLRIALGAQMPPGGKAELLLDGVPAALLSLDASPAVVP